MDAILFNTTCNLMNYNCIVFTTQGTCNSGSSVLPKSRENYLVTKMISASPLFTDIYLADY